MRDDLSEDEIRQWAKTSAVWQQSAYAEQEAEFTKLMADKLPTLPCVGCGKVLTFYEQGENPLHGHFHGGGWLTDSMGYGSCKHDMDKIALVICDECVDTKCLYVDWLSKLHKYSEAGRAS
jgi:hypothetical protein